MSPDLLSDVSLSVKYMFMREREKEREREKGQERKGVGSLSTRVHAYVQRSVKLDCIKMQPSQWSDYPTRQCHSICNLFALCYVTVSVSHNKTLLHGKLNPPWKHYKKWASRLALQMGLCALSVSITLTAFNGNQSSASIIHVDNLFTYHPFAFSYK